MRSRASYRGHPLHPALVPFPFAFLCGAFVADAASLLTGSAHLGVTGAYLAGAGVVTGLLAAVPGAVDYLHTVPPRSSGKKRATRHAAVNLSALLLFALAGWVRGGAEVAPDPGVVLVEAIGAALLVVGGWMGGVLVNRNQIGVDHRYAGAGKWKEARVRARPGEGVVVAAADELEVDQMKLLRVDGRRVVLARTGDGYVAFDDRCSHRGGSLAGGMMACGTVMCPWHGSQFDARTGAVRAGPAREPIPTYRVERVGDEIRLIL